MKNILIFGGSFDPPHEGHKRLLESAIKTVAFDRVFVIPARIPPHKERELALSYEMREAALEDLFGDIPQVEISDIESKRKGKSYTVDTVREMQCAFPESTIHLLMGTDMFLSFKAWYCFEELLKTAVLIVGARDEDETEKIEAFRRQLLKDYRCKGIILCNNKPIVISSTALRSIGDGCTERILKFLNDHLDLKRARHVIRVADYARRLAPRYGIDPEKAYLAGLLHDCTKCKPMEWHVEYAGKNGLSFSDEDLDCPKILHQFTGAIFAEDYFGVTDPDVLNAVRYHTTGRAGMTDLEKLILFADSCEPGRTYPGVLALRAAGEEDLDKGVFAFLNESIIYIIQKEGYLHPLTVEARNSYLRR